MPSEKDSPHSLLCKIIKKRTYWQYVYSSLVGSYAIDVLAIRLMRKTHHLDELGRHVEMLYHFPQQHRAGGHIPAAVFL